MVYKIVVAFFLSSVKYVLGVAWCMARIESHLISFFVTLLGGATGVVVFTYFGTVIHHWWIRIRKKEHKQKIVFSKKNRRLVRLRTYGGLTIVALLSPILISIPVGCIFATTFVHDKKKILLYMCCSLLLWSVTIFGAMELFHVDLTHWFE